MELNCLLGRTGCIETPMAMIPFYRLSGEELILFDSGRESDPELLELLEREQLRVRAVLCTHLHEDHIANNEALIARYGTEIYASKGDIAELLSRDSVPYQILEIGDGDVLKIDDAEIRLLPLTGHTEGQTAYVTPDGVCCVGDAIMTEKPLERAKIPYMDDVDESMVSMERLRQTEYPLYVVAHKGVVSREALPDLIDRNIRKELELYDLLRSRIVEPTPLEQVITDFIRGAGVLSQKMVDEGYVRHTAKVRVFALAYAGEFSLVDGMVIPNRFDRNGE
jgi:glyoxylase-like metal-dependent hydrolase (beta-lactamase superfamily II)